MTEETPLPVAYCAPGNRVAAAFILAARGEKVSEIREHPWLEGHRDVLVCDMPPEEVPFDLQVTAPAPRFGHCLDVAVGPAGQLHRPVRFRDGSPGAVTGMPDIDGGAAAFAQAYGSFSLHFDATQNSASPDCRPWTLVRDGRETGWGGFTAAEALDFAFTELGTQHD